MFTLYSVHKMVIYFVKTHLSEMLAVALKETSSLIYENYQYLKVDIFWRRAIFDGGNKIHCLVNADLLDFDVADQAEKLLEECMERSTQAGKQTNKLWRLRKKKE